MKDAIHNQAIAYTEFFLGVGGYNIIIGMIFILNKI